MMGSLLDRARRMANVKIWKPETAGEGIEGQDIDIKTSDGKFSSTHYLLKLDDGSEQMIQAAEDTVRVKR